MPMFVHVEIDDDVAGDSELAKKLVEVCPVNIFELGTDGRARIVEENEDECVLCDLCIQAAPESEVRVIKLYES
ncbi:MAG: ferredoxin family protein [Dehalococcoidia bacterium]